MDQSLAVRSATALSSIAHLCLTFPDLAAEAGRHIAGEYEQRIRERENGWPSRVEKLLTLLEHARRKALSPHHEVPSSVASDFAWLGWHEAMIKRQRDSGDLAKVTAKQVFLEHVESDIRRTTYPGGEMQAMQEEVEAKAQVDPQGGTLISPRIDFFVSSQLERELRELHRVRAPLACWRAGVLILIACSWEVSTVALGLPRELSTSPDSWGESRQLIRALAVGKF